MKKTITIIILVLMVLGLGGYIAYDKLYTKDLKPEDTKEEKKENTQKIKVVDALDITYNTYVDDVKIYLTLPKIVGDTDEIQNLNKQILNEIVPRFAGYVSSFHSDRAESSSRKISEQGDCDDDCYVLSKGEKTSYKYLEKNNILVIYIKCEVPEGGTALPASGGGMCSQSYFYDIENDKIITDLSSVAGKLGLDFNPETQNSIIINASNELEAKYEV